MSRLWFGHLPTRATERDVENFVHGFGRLREVVMKNGFAFVEFEDSRDAEDAMHELNGRDMSGSRVVVERCRRREDTYRARDSRDSRDSHYDSRSSRSKPMTRYGPPVQTRYRLTVENLSTRCSWQDLKDLMRSAGEVSYADAHKPERNKAVVCFTDAAGLKRAIEKYQDKDINGRRIKLIDDSKSRSRSRSRSPRSRSPRRSRSPVKTNGDKSRSPSRSPSPS